MKFFFGSMAAVVSISVSAASFDCTKATTSVESAICASNRLGALDVLLSENFKAITASDIGSGARSSIRSSQKKWLKDRNACKNDACIEKAYIDRINEICETPVLSGVHPGCIGQESL